MGTDSGQRPVRFGVLGASRGTHLAGIAQSAGMELVAICDKWEKRAKESGERLGVPYYVDYDKFLERDDMEAVMVANFCHEHAPASIKALEAGKHVISETIACKTLAEGVALTRAVENSGKIYMLAENYAYFAYVQEMRRLYKAGEIGEFQYGEGEYNHPMSALEMNTLGPGVLHWRNRRPPTYYPSHAMSPLMHITDTRPVSVNAQSVPRSEKDEENLHVRVGDEGAVMLCRMSNGAMVRLMALSMRGHSIWYRLHGTRGLMENLRTGDTGMLRVTHEPWDRREGDVAEKIYKPDFPHHADVARSAGHGGGDFFVCHHFAEAVRKNEQPYLDVYRGVDMALIGMQAWRSCLENGAPHEIPDFRDESVRKKYENDDWSPFPEDRRPGQPWPSILGDLKPSKEALAYARQVWEEMGFEGE